MWLNRIYDILKGEKDRFKEQKTVYEVVNERDGSTDGLQVQKG